MRKNTGKSLPVVKSDEWQELWIGDVIECSVKDQHIHDYLYMTGEVFWDDDNSQYSIKGIVSLNGKEEKWICPICQIVNKDITFLKKVERTETSLAVNVSDKEISISVDGEKLIRWDSELWWQDPSSIVSIANAIKMAYTEPDKFMGKVTTTADF